MANSYDQERDAVIRKFIALRNDLVQRGSFSSTHGSEYEQYKFMDVFAGTFLAVAPGFSPDGLSP
jgi:hypothetical protein